MESWQKNIVNLRKCWNYTDDSIFGVSEDTEKEDRNLRELVATQSSAMTIWFKYANAGDNNNNQEENIVILVDPRVNLKVKIQISMSENKRSCETWRVSVVIKVLGMVPRSFRKEPEELEIGGRLGIIQITASLLKTIRILRRVLEYWEDLLSLHLQLLLNEK